MRVIYEKIDQLNDTGLLRLNGMLRMFAAAINTIEFGDGTTADNILGQFKTFTAPATADTEFTVAHTLNATPVGALVLRMDRAGDIYDGSSAWTSTNIYLKCDTASASGTLFVF